MNLNNNVSFKPQDLIVAVQRYRSQFIFLIMMALISYTGYQISRVTNVQPDQAYLQNLQQQQKTLSLKGSQKTINELKQLEPAGDVSIPVASGKHNPFALN